MTASLPVPGQDDGTWGYILNNFLQVSLNSDGTLIGSSVASAGAEMTANKNQPNGYAGLNASADVSITNIPTGTTSTTVAIGNDSRFVTAGTAAQALVPTSVKTASSSPYSASPADFVPVDTTSGNVVVNLPSAPADKTRIGVKMVLQTSPNTVTVNTTGSDVFNKASGSTALSLSLLSQGVLLQYNLATNIWYVQSDDLPLAQLDGRYLLQSSLPLAIASGGTGSATQNFVDLTTAQTVGGVKTFSVAPVVPSSSFPESAITNLPTDLASKVPMTTTGQQELDTLRSLPLQAWLAGLANRHYLRANVVCLGDSITEGQGGTTVDNRWLARLRDQLRARFPTVGLTGGGRGFLGALNTGEVSYTWPAVAAGSPLPTTGATLGPKSGFMQLNATGQTITYSLTGDSADIMWVQVAFGGTFSWKVDAGTATNISTNGGSTVDGKITHISLGTAGVHTLTLAWVSGSSDIDGVVEYNGDYSTGIQVHDAGHYGWQTSSWTGVLTSATAGPAAAIAALTPRLIIIMLGVNDQFSNVVPATYQSNLQTIITDLRAAQTTPYPSIVLCMLPPRQGQSGYTYPWSQYVAAAYTIAAADTAGVGGTSLVTVMDFTLGPRMIPADSDVYGEWHTADLVHPSNLGHSMLGDAIANFLSPI